MIELTDRLISIPAAAEALGIAERTVRWWIQIGKLGSNKPCGDPASRAGRRLVPVSEINRIIEESRLPARRNYLKITEPQKSEASNQDESFAATA